MAEEAWVLVVSFEILMLFDLVQVLLRLGDE